MRPRKRFGQHFLQPAWADKLVAAIDPQPDDRFLEIGPGPGALTLRLAPRVAHLTAVEIDRDMAAALAPRLPAHVEMVQADFLDFDLAPLFENGPLRVAGNLPYNISSPILFRLIDAYRVRGMAAGPACSTGEPRPGEGRVDTPAATGSRGPGNRGTLRDAVLMVQREVADRIEAAPGSRDYGVLSVSVQLHADVRRVLTLPPGAFRPPPKVHSAVIGLVFRPPAVTLRNEAVFHTMLRSMFTQRRKTLGNALAPFASSRGLSAREALAAAGIDGGRRAETLHLTELARLAEYFAEGRTVN